MTIPEPIFEQTVRVNTFECDFNQRWKPAAFFQHLTEAAGVHAALLGVGLDAMLARNLFWVHSRMKIKFLGFPRAGEPVTIRTWPKTIQQKLFYIRDFEILDAAGDRLAAATSAWLVIDATSRRMLPPQSLSFDLPTLPTRAGLDEPLEKIAAPADGQERLSVQAAYSAVDMLGHVNNSRYVEWICDAFPLEAYRKSSLEWLQINYDREIRPGETAALLTRESPETPGLWTVEGVNRSNDTRAFESALQWRTTGLD